MNNAGKILVVEDDPVVRNSFEQVLTGQGHAVMSVSSGEEALWQFGHGRYDAVFTGMALRGISGLEVAQELHARSPGLPVIIIASDGSVATRERAAATGVAEFLQKPVSPAQIADAVCRLLPVAKSDAALQPPTPALEVGSAQPMNGVAARLQNVVLFLLAPVFAFFYILAFPVVWLGAVLWSALNPDEAAPAEGERRFQATAAGQPGILKTFATMLAAALVGVAFAVAGPILGIGLLFSFAIRAWVRMVVKTDGSGQP